MNKPMTEKESIKLLEFALNFNIMQLKKKRYFSNAIERYTAKELYKIFKKQK